MEDDSLRQNKVKENCDSGENSQKVLTYYMQAE